MDCIGTREVCTQYIDDAHERLASYLEVVNYLLATYATDAVFAETVEEISSIHLARSEMAAEFGQMPEDKVVRCGKKIADIPAREDIR